MLDCLSVSVHFEAALNSVVWETFHCSSGDRDDTDNLNRPEADAVDRGRLRDVDLRLGKVSLVPQSPAGPILAKEITNELARLSEKRAEA